MGMISVPVMPYIATFDGVKDVVLSLTGLAPPNLIRLPNRPESIEKFSDGALRTINTNISALGSLGFADNAAMKIKTDCFCSYMDLLLTREIEVSLGDSGDSIISRATFGVGFRMAILAYGVDSSLSGSFSGIAASAKLKQGTTSYQILPIGGGLEVIKAAQPLLSNLCGEFTVETLEMIAMVKTQLSDLYIKQSKQLRPDLISVELNMDRMARLYTGDVKDPVTGKEKDIKYMDVMRGQHYALQRLRKKQTLDEALADTEKIEGGLEVNHEVVTDFYTRILGLKHDQKPDGDAIQKRLRIMLYAGT